MTTSISTGGITYDAVWIACELTKSFRPDEVAVHIQAVGVPEVVTYYVHPDFVRYDSSDPNKNAVEPGQVLVIRLADDENGELLVEVPGEPASFGPRLTVASNLVAA